MGDDMIRWLSLFLTFYIIQFGCIDGTYYPLSTSYTTILS